METELQTEMPEQNDPIPAPTTKRRGTKWRRLVGAIVLIYAAACAALVLMESRLIFPGAYFEDAYILDPNRFTPDGPPTGVVETFECSAVDGATLRGRILVRPDARRVVLFLHGNGIHAVEMDGWTQRLSDALSATVLTAEYRGYMNDGFEPSETTVIEDGLSSLDALAAALDVPAESITVYGRSLGGGVAAGVVRATMDRGRPVGSLVLDRTFDSTLHIGQDRFAILPVGWLMRNRFRSDERLRDYQGVVVQLHGPPDEIVPMRYGQALHNTLTTPRKVWFEVEGMRHNDREPLTALYRINNELRRLESLTPAEMTAPPSTAPATGSP